MKSIARKTKDNSGATIIMALLFMLICVMVGAILLATAGTAARDVSHQRDQQKAYLAVSSAVSLLKSDIENCKFYKGYDPEKLEVRVSEKGAAFTPLLKTALGNAKNGKDTDPVSFTLSCGDVEKVYVDFSMTAKCRIEVTCTAYKDEAKAYGMTAEFKKATCDDGFTWELASVEKEKG